eukprot:TRINITY_DN3540_c0_g2_i1.p1 TRINITY_DN3540_c0_g2~~TRINITY_DN3540_c0_g2_i1.p1  ORF type:complete len:114 (-),score=25.81 TRINITY_DN3540_c0_g2_i1:67-408(-)
MKNLDDLSLWAISCGQFFSKIKKFSFFFCPKISFSGVIDFVSRSQLTDLFLEFCCRVVSDFSKNQTNQTTNQPMLHDNSHESNFKDFLKKIRPNLNLILNPKEDIDECFSFWK